MATRPHDVTDLFLAPVVLELDHRLDEFEGMSQDQIELRVEIDTDRQPRDPADRANLVLRSLTHLMDTHNWTLNWVPRGLQVSHEDHHLVLGIPESLRTYLGNTR